jgi:predicted Zn-dependent peptidase
MENIASFTQDMLFEHKANLYTKDNLIIVVAGRIKNLEELKGKLADTF